MLYEETAVAAEQRMKLVEYGPIIRVRLGRPRGMTTPEVMLETNALIDSGAYPVVLRSGLPAKLGLTPIRTTKVNSATERHYPAKIYRVVLVFPSGFFVEMDATELPMPLDNDCGCAIGRSLLKHALFTYDGLTGKYSLTF